MEGEVRNLVRSGPSFGDFGLIRHEARSVVFGGIRAGPALCTLFSPRIPSSGWGSKIDLSGRLTTGDQAATLLKSGVMTVFSDFSERSTS